MRMTKDLNLDGIPIALKTPQGEWVEVGHLIDANLTMDQDDYLIAGSPYRLSRRFYLSLESTFKEELLPVLRELRETPYRREPK